MLTVLGIRLNSKSNMGNNLHYVIIKPRNKITLNLFESERYESAILVQQLIGTLVYYSNYGRYEPRLAQSWRNIDGYNWEFVLKDYLKTENNEPITAVLFKKSLERSIYIFDQRGGVPILSNLKGYKDFIEKCKTVKSIYDLPSFASIVAEGNKLKFIFDQKVNSGLLQILSFSPFGYISIENFNHAGEWNDDKKFISSGPYRIENIEIGVKYSLIKNSNWKDFADNAPDRVIITHNEDINTENQNVIIDAFTNEYSHASLNKYKLVPEYLNSILIGNYDSGFFRTRNNRQVFKKYLNKVIVRELPLEFGVNTRSTTFYPNQDVHTHDLPVSTFDSKASKPLIIEGRIPIVGTARWHAWKVLEKALIELSLPFEFANNESTFLDMTNRKYDLRIRGSSIGGGVEAWGLFVSFCSSMGINFPDPNDRVCNLLSDYENEKLNEVELSQLFFQIINDEAAILPISHYGVSLFFSSNIDTNTFSPALSIMKFDQIGIL